MSLPWLNPGAAIASPFLAGTRTLIVQRRAESVGSNGRTIVTVTTLSIQGIVTPTGNNGITRENSFQVQGKGITVATRTRLYGIALDQSLQAYQPDRILYRGDAFQVVNVQDATEFGGGWVLATCQSVDLVDQAPQQ